jgi:hypothetical protein
MRPWDFKAPVSSLLGSDVPFIELFPCSGQQMRICNCEGDPEREEMREHNNETRWRSLMRQLPF